MRYIVVQINCVLKDNDDIFYCSENIREAINFYYNYDGICILCVYDTLTKTIEVSDEDNLYSVYSSGKLLTICRNYHEYIDPNSRYYREGCSVYDINGNIKYKGPRHKYGPFPYIDFKVPSKEERDEVIKKSSISLEITGFDKLSNIEKVKMLERLCEDLRDKNTSIKISDDYLKDVRFTVRKSFEEKEKDFYTSLEIAKLSCPVGYSVFDVITGECVYVKEKSIYDFKKEAEQYKEMWDNLKSYINFLYSINECEEYNNILLRMKELEIKKEGIKNE